MKRIDKSPGKMDRTELLKNYTQRNKSFKKKMTFHLGADAGFFSEFNNMVLAILFCLKEEIQFSLYSKRANFALSQGWNDFFQPFCEESNLFLHSRYNRRGYQIKDKKAIAPTVLKIITANTYLTQDIWYSFRHEEFARTRFTIPELNLEDANLLDAAKTIISMIWHYEPASRKIIENHKNSVESPEDFISLHIRAGDKVNESKTFSPSDYMERANGLNTSKKAFILTDNYSVIEELKEKYKNWEFFTLCSPSERGYVHSEFQKLDKYQKYLQHLKLFASLDLCAESNKFIGTYSSNPGMFMGMRIGENKCSCIDYDSWVLW